MTTTATPRTGGATGGGCRGCGGGGGSGSGGCACGGSCGGGAGPVRGTSFVRPRFFGGMLLTEGDLQAVDDYVLAKRRLTNRSVLGTGVVCGLEVTCDPCETRTVRVSAGYAIDCCGNDVVLDCPETVDVLALVRELRARSGLDCATPCEDDDGTRDYVLHVVYAEELAEPVAPYSADDCATGDCDWSRVREGYAFELTCEAPPAERSLVDELRDCLRLDEEETKEDSRRMLRLLRATEGDLPEERAEEKAEERGTDGGPSAVRRVAAGRAFAVEMEMIPASREFALFAGDPLDVLAATDLVARSLAVVAADQAHAAGRGTPGVPLNASRRAALAANAQDLAARTLASERLGRLSAAEHARVRRVLEAAASSADLSAIGARDWVALAEHGAFAEDLEPVVLADAQHLQSRILAQQGRTGCRDLDEVAALRFDRVDAQTSESVRRLGRAYVGLFQRCLCRAANPPCPTCTDARVPLARVRVRGCDVVAVCDLERHWVHSPRALAYWFPVVEALREVLEERCCREEERRVVTPVREREALEPEKERQEARGEELGLSVARQARLRGDEVLRERELDRLARTLGEAARQVQPPEDVPMVRALMEALGDRFAPSRGPGAAAGTPTAPAPPPSAGQVPAQQIEEMRRVVERLQKVVEEQAGRIAVLEGRS